MLRALLSLSLLICLRLGAQDFMAMAHEQYDSGKYEEALETLRKLGKEDLAPEAYLLRADCMHKLDRQVEALNDYDRAKILGLNNEQLFLNRGICKTTLGYWEGARMDLASALSFNRENALAYYWLAVVEFMALDNKASIRYLDEAIYQDSLFADAYYMRGANYADMGKTLFALDDLKAALRLKPDHHRAKFHIGVLTMDLGLYEQSLEIFNEMMNLDTDFKAEILYYRGWCYYSMHDSDGACADWVEAARMGDANAEESHRKGCLQPGGKPRIKRTSYARF